MTSNEGRPRYLTGRVLAVDPVVAAVLVHTLSPWVLKVRSVFKGNLKIKGHQNVSTRKTDPINGSNFFEKFPGYVPKGLCLTVVWKMFPSHRVVKLGLQISLPI